MLIQFVSHIIVVHMNKMAGCSWIFPRPSQATLGVNNNGVQLNSLSLQQGNQGQLCSRRIAAGISNKSLPSDICKFRQPINKRFLNIVFSRLFLIPFFINILWQTMSPDRSMTGNPASTKSFDKSLATPLDVAKKTRSARRIIS